MSKKRVPPETGASLNAGDAAKLLKAQSAKGRVLLKKAGLTSGEHQAWIATTQDILAKAFGSHAPQVTAFSNVGFKPITVLGGRPDNPIQARIANLQTRLTLLDEFIDSLQSQAELVAVPESEPYPVRQAPTDLDVIISWSGPDSHRAAIAMRDWLKEMLPGIRPWVSSHDIAKGTAWFPELMAQLGKSTVCVICLTPSNVDSAWIHYEAGSIAGRKYDDRTQRVDARVCVYLLGVDIAAVRDSPLSQFQATRMTKDDSLLLIQALNEKIPSPLQEGVLRSHYEAKWPVLASQLEPILAKSRASRDAADRAPFDESVTKFVDETRENYLGLLQEAAGAMGQPNERPAHWEVVIQPSTTRRVELKSLARCRSFVQSCQIRTNDWEYPTTATSHVSGQDWVGGSYSYGLDIECWRLSQQCVFVHIFPIWDDLQDSSQPERQWPYRLPDGFVPQHFLDVEVTIRTITHIFRFAAKLVQAAALENDESVTIRIRLTGTTDRVLVLARVRSTATTRMLSRIGPRA
jgi:TIR domain